MKSILSLLVLVAPLACLAQDLTFDWGINWSVGLTSASNIISATTTFNPGTPPLNSEQYGELILWPGMTNGTGDLLQTTIEQWPDQSWCGGTSGQWCLRTSVYSRRGQFDGTYASVNPNQPITINFQQSANKTTWTQTALVGGNVISQITSPSGPMTGWGIATECDDDCTGTVSAQTYTNTIIVLDSADPSFGSSAKLGSVGAGTVVSGITSSQGGKVWHIAEISIPEMSS